MTSCATASPCPPSSASATASSTSSTATPRPPPRATPRWASSPSPTPDLVADEGLHRHRPPHQQCGEGHPHAVGRLLQRGLRLHRGALLRHPRREDGPDLVRAALALREVLHSHQRGRREEVADQRVPRRVQGPGSSTSPSSPTTSSRRSTRSRGRPSSSSTSTTTTTRRLRPRAQRHRRPRRDQRHQVLVDGDDEGYLLQIFTKNLIGPIFIEIIQRKNHLSFGEGNFGALFRSIERDQAKRGVFGPRRGAPPGPPRRRRGRGPGRRAACAGRRSRTPRAARSRTLPLARRAGAPGRRPVEHGGVGAVAEHPQRRARAGGTRRCPRGRSGGG